MGAELVGEVEEARLISQEVPSLERSRWSVQATMISTPGLAVHMNIAPSASVHTNTIALNASLPQELRQPTREGSVLVQMPRCLLSRRQPRASN